MVSSFNSPDCIRFQKFTRGSWPNIAPKSNGFAFGSSGIVLKNPSNIDESGFPLGGGCGFSVVKYEKKNPYIGLSFGPGPGISMSSPLLMNDGACVAPQSLVTNPLKPSSLRRISIRAPRVPQADVPLSLLYEHMIDDTPAFTASTKGAT